MQKLYEIDALDAVEGLIQKSFTAVEMVRALLSRIGSTEARILAWETIAGQDAMRSAMDVDDKLGTSQQPLPLPLLGVPIGIKDIVDTAGTRTACGFPPFDDRVPEQDAYIVRRLREAGAIILGKTVTTQFAWGQPSRTRNPWSVSRSPGGSSSGSAAAVAAGHVPLAIGTQTAGSVLRPAAFNGVVGYKPSFGLISTEGVFPLAPSLDHIGCLARTVADCQLFLNTVSQDRLSAEPPGRPSKVRPSRLGWLPASLQHCKKPVVRNFRTVLSTLSQHGVSLREVDLSVPLMTAIAAHRIIILSEAARVHTELLAAYGHGGAYGPVTKASLEVGRGITEALIDEARVGREAFARALEESFAEVDGLLLPTVGDVAPPIARRTTGDSSLQAPFSLTGVPAISIPSGFHGGLPVAVQLVAPRGHDENLLQLAAWIEMILGLGRQHPSRLAENSSAGT